MYDLFLNACSKKGIPSKIMSSRLPLINNESSNILQGVVGFTVELEIQEKSNVWNVRKGELHSREIEKKIRLLLVFFIAFYTNF